MPDRPPRNPDILGRPGTARPWHDYVFDAEQRRLVGDFEGMYAAGVAEGFDPWFQSDPRRIDSRICVSLLEQVTWESALDLGCGKGGFTVRLKRADNRVTGIDLSQTAIQAARNSYPDLEWVCAPIADYLARTEPVDLVLARETLTYLADWREAIDSVAGMARYLYVDQYVPENTIGHVPSHGALIAELERHFEPIEIVVLPRRDIVAFLGQNRR